MSQTVKETIEFTQNEYEVVKQIAEVYDSSVADYLGNLITQAIDTELNNPEILGLQFCKKLKKQIEPDGGSE